jgi:hypothetical protein
MSLDVEEEFARKTSRVDPAVWPVLRVIDQLHRAAGGSIVHAELRGNSGLRMYS